MNNENKSANKAMPQSVKGRQSVSNKGSVETKSSASRQKRNSSK